MSMGLGAFEEELGSDLFQAVYDQVAAGLVVTDLDGYLRHCNGAFQAMLGRTAEEVRGVHFTELTHPEDRETSRARFQTLLAGPESRLVLEKRYLRGDGSAFWAQSALSMVPASAEHPAFAVCVITSIEKRKAVEASLHEKEERLRAALTASGTGTFRWDIRTNALDWDENLDRLFGLPPGETARSLESFVALVHPEDRAGVIERCQRCRAQGTDFSMEFRTVWPDGSIHWLDDQGKTFLDEEGAPSYMTGACVDITARKAQELALRKSEARFQAFMHHLPAAAWITDAAPYLVYVNEAFERLLGQPAADLIGRNASDFYPPEIARHHLDNIARVIATGVAIQEVEEALLPDGTPARFLVHKFPVPVPGPGPDPSVLVGGLAFDLTERLRAEQALQESEARFRALAETVPQLVWSTRADGDCDYLSPQWAEFTGRPVEEQLGGTRWTEALHPEDRVRAARAFLQAVESQGPYDLEYRIRSASGQYRWFKTRGIALRDGTSGEVLRWVGSCTDIDDQHRHQEELARLNAELETARDAALEGSRAKSAFLANMSHELRTPLNAIIGYAEMLRDLAEDEGRADLQTDLTRIHGAGLHLLGLINSILDLSKIESGRMEIQVGKFHPGDLVHGVVDTLTPLASSRRNQLEVAAPYELGEMVSDGGKLRQILINLIGNACKFTEGGVVRVEVWGERTAGETGEEGEWLVFSVSDTGPGISPADQQRLFQDFVQLSPPSGGVGTGGTGLGLAITHRFCSMLGGTISLQSEPGRGATFSVRLPRCLGG